MSPDDRQPTCSRSVELRGLEPLTPSMPSTRTGVRDGRRPGQRLGQGHGRVDFAAAVAVLLCCTAPGPFAGRAPGGRCVVVWEDATLTSNPLTPRTIRNSSPQVSALVGLAMGVLC